MQDTEIYFRLKYSVIQLLQHVIKENKIKAYEGFTCEYQRKLATQVAGYLVYYKREII